ncbi:MAG TPA: DUF5700 domain-containing putative Zn-dependent protease [Gemmatimonadaceae bacterium]|jgi:hypothetical protein|nr:DUF5700 domain-containing putative Zn-dependent protease [Gemmatimonadaceae bacterium]
MRVLTATTLFVCAASTIAAQTRPLSDSVMALNRAGKWEQAGQLADRAMRTAPNVEERCAVFVGGLYAAARLSLIVTGPRQLTVFDDMCANTTAVRQSARDLEEIRRIFTLPPMPTTGVDWSGVDQFWMAVDTLSRDIEPSPAQWRALLISPGYRIATISHPTIARAIELAFKPSRRAQRDSVLARLSEDSATIAHLLAAAAARDDLKRFRAALAPHVADSIAYAIRNAGRFLPAGATDHAPPLVTFTIFASDGYSQEPGVVLDLYHVRETGLADFLSHEFHHHYGSALDRTTYAVNAGDNRLYQQIRQLKNEGIADMIDKPHPLVEPAGMQWYANMYNAAYEKTPATLKVLDSLLVAAGTDSAKLFNAGTRAQRLLISGSHPNGAYMARTILETFGRDSLIATTPSAFAFIRMYEAAEAKRGNASPFSAEGRAALGAIENRHLKP